MVVTTPAMELAASAVAPCTWATCWPISSVAFAVCVASACTSEATTTKPLPASPARAASMVALSASRLVWPAIDEISVTTSPIFAAALFSISMVALVRRTCAVARLTTIADSLTRRAISSSHCRRLR